MYSKPPFSLSAEDPTEVLLQRISESKINTEDGNWRHISQDAKDLIRRMLNLDPRQRINAQGILRNPWLANMDSLPDLKLNLNDPDSMKVDLGYLVYKNCFYKNFLFFMFRVQ
jgi:serine/threonine protein kinase